MSGSECHFFFSILIVSKLFFSPFFLLFLACGIFAHVAFTTERNRRSTYKNFIGNIPIF